jgi:ABC-type multidrug transport system fused ATPase/permease subunit
VTSGNTQPSLAWWTRLGPYVQRQRRALLLCAALSVVGQVLVGLLPLIQKVVLDDAVLDERRPLWPWLGLMLAVGTLGFVLHYQRRYLAAKISLNLQHELRVAIHRHLHTLDFARHDQLSTGDVMARATGDVTLVQLFVNQLPLFVANLTLLVVAVGVMFVLSPSLSLVIAVFVPAFLYLSVRFRDRVFPASFSDQRLAASVAGVVEEAISGVRVVKAFGQERQEQELLFARAADLFRSRLRTARLTAHYSATLQALPTLAQLGVLAFGGWLAIQEQLTLGVFLAFFSYLLQLLAPVRLLSGMLSSSQQARVGAERVLALLELGPVVQEAPAARVLAEPAGAIELSHVAFGFAGGEPVLRDVSLRIQPGERLGIVGASGSGKTTLALLLARFYDPTAGSVRVDGQDVRELTLDSLRRNVGIVFEESFLFSTTIRENIAFGRPGASDAEVEAAARAAHAHDFILEMPEGYASRVGERGETLSGGQRQRIALARMFLQNPKVLVLDDATSAIDSDTEEAIFRSLEELMRDRTTVVIAHRQSTLRLATRAVVLDGGRLVGDAAPDELLQNSALYRNLLAGPDVAAEEIAPVPEPVAIDPRAWPEGVAREGASRAASVEAEMSLLALKGGGGGGGGGGGNRDLGGGRAAFVTATPELIAREKLLPPLSGEPEVDLEQLTRERREFSLKQLLGPFRGAIILCVLLVAVDAATSLAAPMLIGRGVDDAIVTRQEPALWLAVGVLFLVQLVSWANARSMQYRTAKTAERLLYALRVRMFSHLQRLSLDYFDREHGGRIMARMTTDIEAFAQLFQQGLLTALVSLLTCGGVFVVMFALDWRMSLFACSVFPLLIGGTLVFRHYSRQAYLRARERIARVYGNLQESIAGIRVTQAFARREDREAHFSELSSSYREARLRSMQMMAFYFPYLQLLSVVGKAVTLGVGAHEIRNGRLGAGILIAFLLYLDQFFSPLQQLSAVFDQWIQARVSLGRVRELLSEQSSTPEAEQPRDPGILKGEVRFEGVRFAYHPSAPEALRGIDLRIQPGETVGLIGTTGAGKSTFVKLAARFYDPTHGRVSVDGIPLTEIAIEPFRRQLGYVPQEPFLFSGTVRSNIAYASPQATDLEVERSARAVGAHDFVASLPQGYLTPVVARGRSLSAGQRQLLCLARAELVRPKILILDEATANLDLRTEAEVQRAMRRVARGRTTLLIAHRLQTARAADRIVVIEEGRIVETGSHDQLVQAGGRYQRLWGAFQRGEARGPSLRAIA